MKSYEGIQLVNSVLKLKEYNDDVCRDTYRTDLYSYDILDQFINENHEEMLSLINDFIEIDPFEYIDFSCKLLEHPRVQAANFEKKAIYNYENIYDIVKVTYLHKHKNAFFTARLNTKSRSYTGFTECQYNKNICSIKCCLNIKNSGYKGLPVALHKGEWGCLLRYCGLKKGPGWHKSHSITSPLSIEDAYKDYVDIFYAIRENLILFRDYIILNREKLAF